MGDRLRVGLLNRWEQEDGTYWYSSAIGYTIGPFTSEEARDEHITQYYIEVSSD